MRMWLQMWWLVGNAQDYILRQWFRVRIRLLSQWKTLRTGRVTVYTACKILGHGEGNLPLRPHLRAV